MLTFLLRRILSGLVLILASSFLMFWLMSLSGTNVARNIVGQTATQEQVAAKATELGLDQPLLTRYFDWIGPALRGDFGSSWFSGQSVIDTLAAKLPVTLSILVVGLLIATVFAIVIGVAAAVRGGWLDRLVQGLAILGFALPSFLIALVLVVGLRGEAADLPGRRVRPVLRVAERMADVDHPARRSPWRSVPWRPRPSRSAAR